MNKTQGVLVIVSGFSGAGKGTLMKELLKSYDNYALSVSATTRSPRKGEVDGKDYFFVTKEKFEEMIAGDELIEYAQYVDNYYGTPKKYVEEQLSAGKDVILEIEVQGAMIVKQKMPQATTIFVTPPSAEELKKRLVNRGTETMDVINSRMKRACEEAAYMPSYDYLLINDDLQKSTQHLHEVIKYLHYRSAFSQPIITEITEELKNLD